MLKRKAEEALTASIMMAKIVDHRQWKSMPTDFVNQYVMNATQQKEITNHVIAMQVMHRRIY